MEKVKQIYHSLSKAEERYFKSYLDAFQNRGTNKALELIKILDKYPDISQAEISEKLYGDPKSKAFIMLKSRVLEKLMETLILSINLHNNPVFKEEPSQAVVINLLKDLTYAIVLLHRGLRNLAKDLFDKCAKIANEYAKPEFEILALLNLRPLYMHERKSFLQVNERINDCFAKLGTDVKGSEIYFDFMSEFKGKSRESDEILPKLDCLIENLEKRLNENYSARTHNFCLLLEVQRKFFQEDFSGLRNVLFRYITLLEENVGLGTKIRTCNAYLQVARLEIESFDIIAANAAIEKVFLNTSPPKITYLHGCQLKILSAILSANFSDIGKTLESLEWYLQNTQNHSKNRYGEFRYLQSCRYFLTKDFEKALYYLNKTKPLQVEDKSGWNIWIRVYEIQIFIEQGKLDLASSKIENLRKQISAYTPGERLLSIYRFLSKLERNTFNFKQLTPEMESILSNLNQGWIPHDPEIIRFDTWIEAHQTDQDFYPLFLEKIRIAKK